jgi:hypothetical protein
MELERNRPWRLGGDSFGLRDLKVSELRDLSDDVASRNRREIC